MLVGALFSMAVICQGDVFSDTDQGNAEAVQAYLDRGGDVNATDANGRTALHHAAARVNAAIVRLLLEHRANPNAADKQGVTPLLIVARSGQVEVAEFLLAAHARPDLADNDGVMPLAAAQAGGQTCMSPIARLLRNALTVVPVASRLDGSAEAPPKIENEARDIVVPRLGMQIPVGASIGRFEIVSVVLARFQDGEGKSRLSVRVTVLNNGHTVSSPSFCVALIKGGKLLGRQDFGETLVHPSSTAVLYRSIPLDSDVLPDGMRFGLVSMCDPALTTEQPKAPSSTSTTETGWPQFRGPLGCGLVTSSPTLADQWSPSGPRKLWEMHDIHMAPIQYAGGASTPSVVGDRVFVYAHDRGRNEDVMVAVDARSGQKLWEKRFSSTRLIHGASGSPCVQGKRVYFMAGRVAYCLDAETGAVLWRAETGVPALHHGIWMWDQEVSSSFTVSDGVAMVFLGPLFGFDVVSGQVRWRAPDPDGWAGAMSTASIWRSKGRNLAIYSGWKLLCCIDPATGRQMWTEKLANGGECSTPTPAIMGDTLAVHIGEQLRVYDLSVDGPRERWSIPYSELMASPVITDRCVYTVGRHMGSTVPTLRCNDVRTGRTLWDFETNGAEYSSPLVADGKVFLLADRGRTLMMFQASPNTGRLLGRATVNGLLWSSPAFADGRLYVRLGDGLVCYDLTRAGNGGS